MKATYFFSFRSPYSWIASELLLQLLPDWGVLELVPFWEPDADNMQRLVDKGGKFPYTPMSECKHRYILQDVRRLAQHLNLSMRWPVDDQPWWDLSHLAYLKAASLGYGEQFFWGVYRARWGEGRNISEPAEIAAICHDIRAPQELIVNAHKDPETRAQGMECLLRIYQEDVFGVPYFMVGRERFWGVDRLQHFLEKLNSQPHTDLKPILHDNYPTIYEFDHAGGCG